MAEFMTETEERASGVPGPGAPGEPREKTGEGTGPADAQEAAAQLERTRALVDPELRAAVESLPGSMRRIGLYHFGWQQADGSPAAGNAGKAIRGRRSCWRLPPRSADRRPGRRPSGRRRRSNWSTTSRCCTTT